jgi:hypothetical protein
MLEPIEGGSKRAYLDAIRISMQEPIGVGGFGWFCLAFCDGVFEC